MRLYTYSFRNAEHSQMASHSLAHVRVTAASEQNKRRCCQLMGEHCHCRSYGFLAQYFLCVAKFISRSIRKSLLWEDRNLRRCLALNEKSWSVVLWKAPKKCRKFLYHLPPLAGRQKLELVSEKAMPKSGEVKFCHKLLLQLFTGILLSSVGWHCWQRLLHHYKFGVRGSEPSQCFVTVYLVWVVWFSFYLP